MVQKFAHNLLIYIQVYLGFLGVVMGRLCPATIAPRARLKWAKYAVCLMVAVLLANARGEAWADGIALPDPPKAAPPPVVPREKDPVVIRAAEKEQQKKEDKVLQEDAKVTIQEIKQGEVAKKEDEKARPMYGFVELSLLYAKVLTTGSRKKYIADPTTHIGLWGRVNPDKSSDVVQVWAGFRIAPFSGSGIQKSQAGRYALTYFGPGIAFGRVDSKKPGQTTDDSQKSSGWLVSLGVSAVSKLGQKGEIVPSDATDFKPAPWAMDSPGAWCEYRYLNIFAQALSYDYIAGAHVASGKTFVYGGLGLAGWL